MRLRPKPVLWTLLLLILLAWAAMGAWHVHKPLPAGLDTATVWMPAEDVSFLTDVTYTAIDGERRTDQAIFDEILRLVRGAEHVLVLDMFLFNDFAGETGNDHRPLSRELTEALLERKAARPDLDILLITDPVNSVYGSHAPDHLAALDAAGVEVVLTDLTRLRDPNPLWSGLWRLCCRWMEPEPGNGWLPNPLGDGKVSLASLMRLLNVKANHRKTVIADHDDRWVGLVTSANPHDASSRHGNVALRFSGPAVPDLLDTETAVARMSGVEPLEVSLPTTSPAPPVEDDGEGELRVLTEAAIRDALIERIGSARRGERLDLAMFYLSHRGVIEALVAAHGRGVQLRVLLDANRDAFGREKDGIPNRPVGMELHRAGIPVRWCHTEGEQCHSKILLHRETGGRATLLLGSANFTRRNLDNYNLETNVEWRADDDHPAMLDATRFFETRWGNGRQALHSLPFEAFADDSTWRYWRYRLMEATGLSAF
ncbi:phospholipase D family protein [Guyparkeria sp.]|uniref:phospholipase D family protein n=1 Tax=Guyparkeria sp. TaxID=2035736 RepID=UPI0039705E69